MHVQINKFNYGIIIKLANCHKLHNLSSNKLLVKNNVHDN